jgi:hypothetical protein
VKEEGRERKRGNWTKAGNSISFSKPYFSLPHYIFLSSAVR